MPAAKAGSPVLQIGFEEIEIVLNSSFDSELSPILLFPLMLIDLQECGDIRLSECYKHICGERNNASCRGSK